MVKSGESLRVKALIIGASGMTGNALLGVLRRNHIEAFGTYHSSPVSGMIKLDVKDNDAVERCFDQIKPNLVFLAVNNVGGVDHCEDHPAEAWALNVTGTKSVASATARAKATLVYYSTDFLFDGKSGPYSEEDKPFPINVYGRTKWEAEQIIQAFVSDHLILRTTAVFGWKRESRNFAMTVWQGLSTGKPMRLADDQWGNPTFVDYLAETTFRLIERGAKGTLNVVGKDRMPRSELAKALAQAMGLDPALVISVPSSELKQRAPRPLQAGLKTDKLQRFLGTMPMDLNESLRRFRHQWKSDSSATHGPETIPTSSCTTQT